METKGQKIYKENKDSKDYHSQKARENARESRTAGAIAEAVKSRGITGSYSHEYKSRVEDKKHYDRMANYHESSAEDAEKRRINSERPPMSKKWIEK